MRFKNDGCGWRDLRIERTEREYIQISLDKSVKSRTAKNDHFICIGDGVSFADFHLSKTQLRRFAKAILKETEK